MLEKAAARAAFPPLETATEKGLLAIGGDLSAPRLLAAYRHGIFPWYNADQPILWWSPNPRCVLFPERFQPSRSLKKSIRQRRFRFTLDAAFGEVIAACSAPRANAADTWITAEMKRAYTALHRQGIAHSAETWQHNKLVGGLYGVALGGVFFGESMFSRVADSSKVALTLLIAQLRQWDFRLLDCQVSSPHLLSLGAEEIPRCEFIAHLRAALRLPDRVGNWSRLVSP